jgi:N-acyl-D-amino-acid deacylase
MQLVEQKKIELQSPVHGLLRLPEPSDARWKQVTVLNLLQHTGGWDREKSFDPMFLPLVIARDLQVPPPAGPEAIIRYMVKHPLDFDPGSRYAYSNFGFCLLGRVIERISGVPYEKFVQQNVLRPLGISRMQIGRSLAAQHAADEATYYDAHNQMVPAVVGKIGELVAVPYGGFFLEALDSHGGWIASATDLLRFAAAFDSPANCKILQPESITAMFARPEGATGRDAGGRRKRNYYACGWDVWNFGRGGLTTCHSGLLSGSSTLLVRRRDGISWAALFNTDRGADGKTLTDSIDAALHQAANAVKNWPSIDLFEKSGVRS